MEENTYDKIVNELVEMLKANHNIILTGAPGTGKTYLAREIAKELLEIKRDNSEDSDKELDSCSRFGFVQFHPSYDYTDFVEGLRPITGKDGNFNIGFARKDGILKSFCKKALHLCGKGSFDDALGELYNEIMGNDEFSIKIKSGLRNLCINDDDEFVGKGNGDYVIKKEGLKKIYDKFGEKYDIDIPEIMELLNVKGEASYYLPVYRLILDRIVEVKHVFVIDEINRGEISKIFGELFFSIDPGYRGTKGAVQTQYANMQNEPNEFDKVLNNGKHGQFFVPENVYIIGTMNDIDRSVESMDFAMRRRFAFYEVEADKNTNMLSQLDDEKDKAIKVMKALNNAIWNNDTNEGIEGLNSAYHIGASYFLKIKDYTDDSGESKDKKTIWKKLWHYHIKGILKEYLRGLDNAEEIMETLKNKYNDAADIKG